MPDEQLNLSFVSQELKKVYLKTRSPVNVNRWAGELPSATNSSSTRRIYSFETFLFCFISNRFHFL